MISSLCSLDSCISIQVNRLYIVLLACGEKAMIVRISISTDISMVELPLLPLMTMQLA